MVGRVWWVAVRVTVASLCHTVTLDVTKRVTWPRCSGLRWREPEPICLLWFTLLYFTSLHRLREASSSQTWRSVQRLDDNTSEPRNSGEADPPTHTHTGCNVLAFLTDLRIPYVCMRELPNSIVIYPIRAKVPQSGSGGFELRSVQPHNAPTEPGS